MRNFVQKPTVDLHFENLSYFVCNQQQDKIILRNVNGAIKSGHITAILGASGSGKTTLLNILSGYVTHHVSGKIYVNGQSRNIQNFRKISRYILQDKCVHKGISVEESMRFAANFKLGYCKITGEEKKQIVEQTLAKFNLTDVKDTFTEELSGGERKRLSIAVELIDDPSIIFLDEPTTGLDEQSSFQCISLLKKLAEDNKTVVISIHQPSAKLFSYFAQVYVLSDGQCAYQGHGKEILSFLNHFDLVCPIYYNPIDFLIDVSIGEYGEQLENLVQFTQNGKFSYTGNKSLQNVEICTNFESDQAKDSLSDIPQYYSSSIVQFTTFINRFFLQAARDISALYIRAVLIVVVVAGFSTIFFGVGNDATKILANVSFLFGTIVSFVFTAMMSTLLYFPTEINLIRREYFNKWFKIWPYFVATSVQAIPFFLIFCTAHILICYPLTGQPIEIERMGKGIIATFSVSMVTEALSQIVGCIFGTANALFFGAAIICPFVLCAILSLGHKFELMPLVGQYIAKTSFPWYGLEAMIDSVYQDREQLNCPEDEIFCGILSPKEIIPAFGYGNCAYWTSICTLIFMYVCLKICGFYVLKERLSPTILTIKIMECNKYFLK